MTRSANPVYSNSVGYNERTFAPVVGVQNTIRQLVDWNTKEVALENSCDAFGKGLTEKIPYAYVGKRYDGSSGFVYFGKRFYDPNLGRWLTTDPLGAVDHSNLYQYVFNNPYRYQDPNGESIGGYLLGLGEMVLGGALIVTGGVLEIATFGGYTIGCGVQIGAGIALIGDGLGRTVIEAQDIKMPNISWKNTDVYVPDRPLPRDPRTKEPVPEADGAYTQLGTKDGTKGKYPQAREFDAQGKPVKDIDFTDHGRPKNHPNPHEHKWKPNPTGGTPQRSPEAEPLS